MVVGGRSGEGERERNLGLGTQATMSGSESKVAGGRSGKGRPVVGEACASEWGPCRAEVQKVVVAVSKAAMRRGGGRSIEGWSTLFNR